MTGPKHCGCSIHRDAHGDCGPGCDAYGCLPSMRPVPLPDLYTALAEQDVSAFRVSAPVLDAEMRRLYRGIIGAPDHVKVTGPALHDTQVRAAALIAASNMVGGTAGFHPHASDIRAWETRVLDTARRFEHYINGTPPGSEETPK